MDARLIEEKLEALRRCVQRIESRTPPSAEALAADADLQDIIALNLTRAVQLCVDIAAHVIADAEVPAPGTMAGAFEALGTMKVIEPDLVDRMRRAVGFRNVAVHSYQAIDWQIVYAICSDRLGDFKEFARAVESLF